MFVFAVAMSIVVSKGLLAKGNTPDSLSFKFVFPPLFGILQKY